MNLLIRDAELGRRRVDVLVAHGKVAAVGTARDARHAADEVIDAGGGALLPGLHDHHVHLRALAAAASSLQLDGDETPAQLDALLSAHVAANPGGVRAVGWHEHASGPLDRARLDRLVPHQPIRVQHATGALWVLNTKAILEADAIAPLPPNAERDGDGALTGRFYRSDGWPPPSSTLPKEALTGVSLQAARLGVTGFTEATPGQTGADLNDWAALVRGDVLVQRLTVMAEPSVQPDPTGGVGVGPVKVVLDDDMLPGSCELDQLLAAVVAAGRRVAFHCATADQLAVAIAGIARSGIPGHRIEHGSVIPPALIDDLAGHGIVVVTQPGFISCRGDRYIKTVASAEQPWLYRAQSLLDAGIGVAFGSDAPHGPADPWTCMRASVDRRTREGAILNRAEATTEAAALRGFLGSAGKPHRPRRVRPGAAADLCLLDVGLDDLLADLSGAHVHATVVAGRVVWQR